MKKIILILFFLWSIIGNAQNWCPAGATWMYDYIGFNAHGYFKVTYDGDTIIGGIYSKRLTSTYRIKTIIACNPQNPKDCITTIDTGTDREYYTYFSNDTVFFYYDGAFRSVLYFNAKAGDTLSIFGRHLCSDSIINLVVDSIGKIPVNGDSLRFYIAHAIVPSQNTILLGDTIKVIEKIGVIQTNNERYFTQIPVFSCGIIPESNFNFTCYKDSLLPSFPKGADCNDRLLSATTVSSISYSIYPNPSLGKFEISAIPTNGILEIYNSLGIKIYTQDIKAFTHTNIDISSQSAGVYFLHLKLSNGAQYVHKIMKE
ncbi:MAG: T9SS type A sorting domain-containing protein [Chitinophagales bacterium]|nr:T9SS type A sorting domain-containing protein [Chitinophagales bacterium]MBX2985008.1 T9SS type A sorting domain-containing protein [Bacteroidia bacterium]